MKEYLKKNVINLRGKPLKKKLIVVESDDWGSIRIPNKEVSQKLIKKGLLDKNNAFDTLDTLESGEDFKALYEVLNNYKDHLGKPAVFTTNMVMANPDFKAIKANDFKEYKYENFTQTYKRLHKSNETFNDLQYGIEEGWLTPQFHAREHLNVSLWMSYLQKQNNDFLDAFNYECFSIKDSSIQNRRDNIMATYDYYSEEDLNVIEKSIGEGLIMFENVFNQSSETTICPCYVWDPKVESFFNKLGINAFQGSKYQHLPLPNSNQLEKKLRYMGQKENNNNYIIRNCLFEPALDKSIDWVSKCLESINVAFFWGKPAVIGSHRINYVGGIDKDNREKNLRLLNSLLSKILKKWPEVEFISSDLLLKYYNNK